MNMKNLFKVPYEVKHLGAPEFYELTSIKDMLDNIGKEQEWERIAKKKHPFKYYVIYKGIDKLEYLQDKFNKFLFKSSCFLKPRNKFTFKYVPNDYMDLSDQIFYINFEMFERFVEREEPFKYYDEYKEDTEFEAKLELSDLMFLYSWWQTRKIKKFEEVSQEDREMLERLIKLSYRFWT